MKLHFFKKKKNRQLDRDTDVSPPSSISCQIPIGHERFYLLSHTRGTEQVSMLGSRLSLCWLNVIDIFDCLFAATTRFQEQKVFKLHCRLRTFNDPVTTTTIAGEEDKGFARPGKRRTGAAMEVRA